MRRLKTVVCVWHPETDELLFEGASAKLGVDAIRSVVGAQFPENPGVLVGYPIAPAQGRALLAMMGLEFVGSGEFQVSREPVVATVRSGMRH